MKSNEKMWWAHLDSNQGLTDYDAFLKSQ
jgi:hypothetical protein